MVQNSGIIYHVNLEVLYRYKNSLKTRFAIVYYHIVPRLCKLHLLKVLEDYPDARNELEEKAVEILKRDQERRKESLCPGATTADASRFKFIQI